MSSQIPDGKLVSEDDPDDLITHSKRGKRFRENKACILSEDNISERYISGMSPKRLRTLDKNIVTNEDKQQDNDQLREASRREEAISRKSLNNDETRANEHTSIDHVQAIHNIDTPSPNTARQLDQIAASCQREEDESLPAYVDVDAISSYSSDSDPAEVVFLDDEEDDGKTSGEILKEPPPNHVKERKGLNDFQCPVCLSEPEVVAITTCGHIYCSDCVFKALSSSNRATASSGECSICRRKVQYRYVTFLEFKLGGQARSLQNDESKFG